MYLAEGFDAFLSKPIHPERLEKLILKLLPRELLCFDKEEEKKLSGDENREKGSLVIDTHEDSFVSQKEENRKEAIEREGKGEASEKEEKEDRKLPEIEGIDWEYAGKHLPTKELLFSTLKDFYKTMNQEARCLEEFFEEINREAEPDFSPYRIKVHSMKSSANLIGATKLGDWAKALEEGARGQKKSVLDELHPVFMKEWRCCHERLSLLFTGERQEQEVDKDLLLENLKALKLALEELDMDAMDQCMEKIEEFPVSEEISGLIEELGAHVINMDTEKAIPLVEELRKKV